MTRKAPRSIIGSTNYTTRLNMKYIHQFSIIIFISFIGEILHHFISLPIPASIYGLVLMFLCLHFHLFQVNAVKDTSHFLIEIMPLMFIPAAVGLISSWSVISQNLVAYLTITLISTFAVMIVSGRTTQAVLHHGKRKDIY